MRYIGIDGCKAGWFYVALGKSGDFRLGMLEKFAKIEKLYEAAKLILVDIPIGLRSMGGQERLCDLAARKAIRPRGSSVFPAPARPAIHKLNYNEGTEENYRCLGRRLSKQSWAITPKIKEVDDYFLKNRPGRKIREMHPEVCFWSLNGGEPMLFSKKRREGFVERLGLLGEIYPRSVRVIKLARESYPFKKDLADDDILDALVGAITASYYPNLITLPESPEFDDRGLPMEMVYAVS